MNVVTVLQKMLGQWQGENRLRMMPDDEYQESPATASMEVVANNFLTLRYTWEYEQQAQEGLLVLSPSDTDQGVQAVWMDSWHSAEQWMPFTGEMTDSTVQLRGTYSAGEGPPWGWEIHLKAGAEVGGTMSMYNLVPGHPGYQVVEAHYR